MNIGIYMLLLLSLALTCGTLAGQGAHPSGDPTINAHLVAAQEAQRRKDYTTAEREYKTVLAKVPDFGEIHMNLGLIYQLQGRLPDAMAAFRNALKYKPGLGGANFMLGVDYCEMGDGQRAIPYLTAALSERVPRPESWSWLATAEEITGAGQAELATIDRGLNLYPDNIDLLYLRGHAYERLGQAEVARMKTSGADSYRTEQLLGESYAISSEWPTAVLHFQHATAASSSHPGPHVELGEVLLRAGRREQAEREFDEELRIDPHSVRALVRRGEAKLLRGEVDGSLEDWAQAIATDRLYTERVLGIGPGVAGSENGDSALDQLSDADLGEITELVPELRRRGGAAADLALEYVAQQGGQRPEVLEGPIPIVVKTEGAGHACSEGEARRAFVAGRLSWVAACGPSLLTARSTEEFRTQVASAQFEMGDYKGSVKTLEGLAAAERHSTEAAYWKARNYEKLSTVAYVSLYRQDPNSYRLHQLLGDLSEAMGDDRKAIEEYRAAIALRPTAPNLHYSLGHTLWKNSDVNGARVELEAELAINPRHAGSLHDLGDTYLLEHQPEKALPYLTRASAVGEEAMALHKDLGTAYAEMGDYHRAETELTLALPEDRDGSVHFKLGRTYLALAEKEKAAKEFAISARLNREQHSRLEEQTPQRIEIEK